MSLTCEECGLAGVNCNCKNESFSELYEVSLRSTFSERPNYGTDTKKIFIGPMQGCIEYRSEAITKIEWVAQLTWNNDRTEVQVPTQVDGDNIQKVFINLNEDNEQHLEFIIRVYK